MYTTTLYTHKSRTYSTHVGTHVQRHMRPKKWTSSTCKPANLQTCKPQFDIAAPRVARARALPEAREGKYAYLMTLCDDARAGVSSRYSLMMHGAPRQPADEAKNRAISDPFAFFR